MNRLLLIFAICIFSLSCGSQIRRVEGAPQIVQPDFYAVNIKRDYPHSEDSYTQGLQYVDGVMWEGTGEWGESRLLRYDLESGTVEVLASLPRSEFGEGITVLGDKIYQLTWTNGIAHVYNMQGKRVKDFRYIGEGWGLTSDGESLYMSDGTSYITKLNPSTFKRERKIPVTLRGEAVDYVNELEWIDGKIWANVYTTDYVVIINPETGVVEGVVDCSNLLSETDMTDETDVLNGIAYDSVEKRIFLTGKRWNKLFEVEVIKQ
jgi:glutamine cyclotransferase